MMRLGGVLSSAMLSAVLASGASAGEMFVDPQGLGGTCNDAGSGATAETPLCTLAECLARATTAGDRCTLRAGRYVGRAVPWADGRPSNPITIARYGSEPVEIWGTVPLEGVWRRAADDVFTLETTVAAPLALLETAPGDTEHVYGPWTPLSKKLLRPERMAPGSFAWEPGEPSTLELRRAAGRGDPNASRWRARVAELDLRDRRFLTYEGIVFVEMSARLEGATDVRFDDCTFARIGEDTSVPDRATDPVGGVGSSTPPIGNGPGSPQIEVGHDAPGGDPPLDVLGIPDGGTGSNTPDGARANIGAAWDGNVVHLTGGEVIQGAKTFEGSVVIRELNGVKRSTGSGGIAACVGSIPQAGGACVIDPNDDETTPIEDVNPAGRTSDGESTGRLNASVMDLRDGKVRWVSSAPQYPIFTGGNELSDNGASMTPFVFQVVRNDASQIFTDLNRNYNDDDVAALGEWSCMQNVGSCSTTTSTNCVADTNCPIGETCANYASTAGEYFNCPNLEDRTDVRNSWGRTTTGTPFYMAAGLCTQERSSGNWGRMSTGAACGGPPIFQIRGPADEQVPEGRAIFSVGLAGSAIYEPKRHSDLWDGWLTMFRSEEGDFWSPAVYNTPMYHFSKYGAYLDGGLFNGGTNHWPRFTNSHYPSYWGIWTSADGDGTQPQLVVEGAAAMGPNFQKSPLVRFLNRYGLGTDHTWNEGTNQWYAFEFSTNSRLRLAAKDVVSPSLATDQVIEFEGLNVDGSQVELGLATEPTGGTVRVNLPNTSGTLLVAPNNTHVGQLLWGDGDSTANTGDAVCQAVGLGCMSVMSPKGVASTCGDAQAGMFYVQCRRN